MEERSTRASEVLLPPLLGLDGVEDRLPLGLVLLANLLDLLLHHGVQGREPLLQLIHAPGLQLAGRQKRSSRWHQCSHHAHACRDPAAPLPARAHLPAGTDTESSAPGCCSQPECSEPQDTAAAQLTGPLHALLTGTVSTQPTSETFPPRSCFSNALFCRLRTEMLH